MPKKQEEDTGYRRKTISPIYRTTMNGRKKNNQRKLSIVGENKGITKGEGENGDMLNI